MNYIDFDMEYDVKFILTGDGSGTWGFKAGRKIHCQSILLHLTLYDDFASVTLQCRHYPKNSFPYTDRGILDDFIEEIIRHEVLSQIIDPTSVEWSEQGRQDETLLDCDAGLLHTVTIAQLQNFNFNMTEHGDDIESIYDIYKHTRKES